MAPSEISMKALISAPTLRDSRRTLRRRTPMQCDQGQTSERVAPGRRGYAHLRITAATIILEMLRRIRTFKKSAAARTLYDCVRQTEGRVFLHVTESAGEETS